MRFTALATACVIVVATASELPAQEGRAREGLWWGAGLGYGWAYVSCDICDSYRDRGLAGTGRIGGTLSRQVLLGADLNGWTRSEGGVDEYLGTIGVAAYWYPRAQGGLYLKGGAAYVAYRIDDDENALTATGFGPQLGVGYDVRVARRFSIQPFVNAVLTLPTGNLDLNGDRQADQVGLALIHAGLSLHWH